MKVQLSPGDKLTVELADTDGTFYIKYDDDRIEVVSDTPDDEGRDGVIYLETFTTAEQRVVEQCDGVKTPSKYTNPDIIPTPKL